MSKETQIKKVEEELKSDDSPVVIINEKNPMAGFMEMFIKEQLWMAGYEVEEINKAWENGNIEADGFDLKIIKGKEKK